MSDGTQWVPRLRSRAEIEHMIRWVRTPPTLNAAFLRGATETCRWALGQQEKAPVTGRVVERPVTRTAIGEEAYEATNAMYNGGRTPVGDLSQGFLEGVEHLAMWITGSDTLGLPEDWPFPEQAQPGRAVS